MQEERETLPGAFLAGARRYILAADTLVAARVDKRLDVDPIYMLYFHSAELALKAYLAQCGEKTSDLKRQWKHNLVKMYEEARRRGLVVGVDTHSNIISVLSLLHGGNRGEGFRYFSWQSRAVPDLEWVGPVLQKLIALVAVHVGDDGKSPGPAVKLDLVISISERASQD